jgi:hypothetical protein
MCSYGSLEALVPADHPLCVFRKLAVLARVQTAGAGLLLHEHFTVDGTLREVA